MNLSDQLRRMEGLAEEQPRPDQPSPAQPSPAQPAGSALEAVKAMLENHGFAFREAPAKDAVKLVLEKCPFDPAHRDAALFLHPDGCCRFTCFHNSCRDRRWQDVLSLLGEADPTRPEKPRPALQYKPADYTDSGNADVFLHLYAADLCYCEALGWLWWTGKHWQRDDQAALRMARDFSAQMLAEAQATEDPAYVKHALSLRSAPRLRALTDLLKPSLLRPADAFDADAFALNTPAGTVDLRTGEMHPHRREDFITKLTAAAPGPEGSELWAEFLRQVTGGDAQKERFLQAVAGMAAVGKVFREGVVIAYGKGGCGKSTFFNTLRRIIGDYGGTIDIDVLMTRCNGNKGASKATLRGKRLVIAAESEEGERLSSGTIKQISSADALTIEEKFKAPETVLPQHSLIMYTNHLPKVGSIDGGTWDRITVCPFTRVFRGRPGEVKGYEEILTSQAGPAILGWIIAGARSFIEGGCDLPPCEEVRNATAEYHEDSDWLGQFLEACCHIAPEATARASGLYRLYMDWAQADGESYRRSRSEFKRALVDRGFVQVRGENGLLWRGLGVKTSEKKPLAANAS